MIKIKCIICNEKIKKPKIGYLHCDKETCKDEFNTNMIELWKMNNPDRVKEMNKKSYSTRKKKLEPKGL